MSDAALARAEANTREGFGDGVAVVHELFDPFGEPLQGTPTGPDLVVDAIEVDESLKAEVPVAPADPAPVAESTSEVPPVAAIEIAPTRFVAAPLAEDAEAELLGLALACGPAVLDGLPAGDFFGPTHQAIAGAMLRLAAAGEAVDLVTTVDALRRSGELERLVGGAHAVEALIGGAGFRAHAGDYRRLIRDAAARRRLLDRLDTARARIASASADEVARMIAGAAAEALAAVAQRSSEPDPDVHALLDEPQAEGDWLVRGLLERRERVILTGGEGRGKSTLLRQIAVMAAAGLSPFTGQQIERVRVLLVDVENNPSHVRRQLRPLVARADVGPAMLVPIVRPEGLDLLRQADREWLADRVEANATELLVIGPLYKLASGDPTSEEIARIVAGSLDSIRAASGCAAMIEAHSPHGSGDSRPIRPYGASLWLRWPEVGLFLSETGALKHWRGARDERGWPTKLRRGGEWPWTADDRTSAPDADDEGVVEHLRSALEADPDLGVRAARRSVREARIAVGNAVIDATLAQLKGEES